MTFLDIIEAYAEHHPWVSWTFLAYMGLCFFISIRDNFR